MVVVAWEVLGIDTGTHQPHLTISALAQAFRPLDAALLLVWILIGIGYGAARARAPVDRSTRESGNEGAGGQCRRSGGNQHSAEGSGGGHHARLVPGLLLPETRSAGVAFWIAVIVAFGLVDLAARRSGGRLATAEEFARLVSGPPVANVALVAAWAFAGWHLFAH